MIDENKIINLIYPYNGHIMSRAMFVLIILMLLLFVFFYQFQSTDEDENENFYSDATPNMPLYNGVYMIGSHNSAHSNALIASPFNSNHLGCSKINYPFSL